MLPKLVSLKESKRNCTLRTIFGYCRFESCLHL
nr:MAG TPA: PAB-dependent polyA-specific ribonuclease subunit [Caudoviricetes sp.]